MCSQYVRRPRGEDRSVSLAPEKHPLGASWVLGALANTGLTELNTEPWPASGSLICSTSIWNMKSIQKSFRRRLSCQVRSADLLGKKKGNADSPLSFSEALQLTLV